MRSGKRASVLKHVAVHFHEHGANQIGVYVRYGPDDLFTATGNAHVVARQLARFWEDHGAVLLEAAEGGKRIEDTGLL